MHHYDFHDFRDTKGCSFHSILYYSTLPKNYGPQITQRTLLSVRFVAERETSQVGIQRFKLKEEYSGYNPS